MTPLSHTLYTVALFFALVSLWLWVKRRRRISRMVRRAVADLASHEDAV